MLKSKLIFLVGVMLLKKFFKWLKVYFLEELKLEPVPVKKLPGAGQKR